LESKHCWEHKGCTRPCPVKDSRSLFCWRIARAEGFQSIEACDACDYRRKWFSHEFSLDEFIRTHDRRARSRNARNILVVDDEPNILFALEETVKAAGHGCISAVDGEEALFLAREIRPDLIVSDVIMPKINGYELCRTVKTDDRISAIPVVLVTVRGMLKDLAEGQDAGADGYLVKPFHAQELEAKISEILPA
jgi:CheY-like chemotaxis protein